MGTSNLENKCWLKRLGWFVFIWAASVMALALVAYFLKQLFRLLGLA
ncbi:DUF2474 domain-containing protein [Methylotenera sp.]|nr:DUF2474 domain-containing protein [Methylotenera sp.]MDI1299292.1 DUF2474 domain-containing protein [Methylotenera sp.]